MYFHRLEIDTKIDWETEGKSELAPDLKHGKRKENEQEFVFFIVEKGQRQLVHAKWKFGFSSGLPLR